MKIIVGLGNPGEKYASTRHNIGFMAIESLAEKYGIEGKNSPKFNAIVGKGVINGYETLLVQPLTFMNLSGEAVSKILNWYKVEPQDMLVVFDDISLDLGRIRFRGKGSDGGHNGIKSIIKSLGGNQNFPRLKIGIGPANLMMKDFVLQKFNKQEMELLGKIIPVCIEGIETFLKFDIDEVQNKYNAISF